MDTNTQTKSETLDALHNTLSKLPEKYHDYLEQESLIGEVRCLNEWVKSYRDGSKDAEKYLRQYGITLLESIKDKLKAATAEMQRIDDESPQGAVHQDVEKMKDINKATRLVHNAEQHLEAVIKEDA